MIVRNLASRIKDVSAFRKCRNGLRGILHTVSDAELWAISYAILTKDYTTANEKLKDFSDDDRRELRRYFNEHVLLRRSKEWTPHGICRTFRFWPNHAKQRYLRFASWVVEALQEKFEVSLGYGSVLSIVRDRDLIPHDDDLDVIVNVRPGTYPTYKHALADLERHMRNWGFKVRGEYVAHRHVTNELFVIDVFVGLEEAGFVSWHPGPRKVLKREDVFPPKITQLYGVECVMPANPERYLSVVYGEDWHTPQPGWSHSFDPTPYADWFWPKPCD